jgi:hypothetical protein
MTSAPPNTSTPSGKSLNISSSHTHSPFQQQQQITSPGVESSSRRSSGFGMSAFLKHGCLPRIKRVYDMAKYNFNMIQEALLTASF